MHQETDLLDFIHNGVIENYFEPYDSAEDIELYFCGPHIMTKRFRKWVTVIMVSPDEQY